MCFELECFCLGWWRALTWTEPSSSLPEHIERAAEINGNHGKYEW